jgi:hypothetical protein
MQEVFIEPQIARDAWYRAIPWKYAATPGSVKVAFCAGFPQYSDDQEILA